MLMFSGNEKTAIFSSLWKCKRRHGMTLHYFNHVNLFYYLLFTRYLPLQGLGCIHIFLTQIFYDPHAPFWLLLMIIKLLQIALLLFFKMKILLKYMKVSSYDNSAHWIIMPTSKFIRLASE